MKFTLSWLKDHLDTTATLAQICDQLVCLGLEVESVHNPADQLKDIIIGQVISRIKHPNADRLSVCMVNVGGDTHVQIVCGAPNVREGMKVAFAPLGTVIPVDGQVLKKGKIRDIESFGMMCSARELNLSEGDDGGIMDLETSANPGDSFVQAFHLGDPIIDIAITPDRADCFGVRGIARDLAARGLGTLKPLTYPQIPTSGVDRSLSGSTPSLPQVYLERAKDCPGFSGVLIRNLDNKESPAWVQERLKAVGVRSINALVDVTNYLTLDLCRPLHVFDADKIQGNLHVRRSKMGEKLVALNDQTYDLDDEMIVIADDTNVLALGGIMGGVSSGCTPATTAVFVECALFDPIRIAMTGRKLNILSDARTRFERGIDPQSLTFGLDAAVSLIQNWCGGDVCAVVHGQYIASADIASAAMPQKPQEITLTREKLTGLSGCDLSITDAKDYLEKLGFSSVLVSLDAITVHVPTFRHDIEGPADLVQEILRLRGYDQIPAAPLPAVHVTVPAVTIAEKSRRCLAARGFFEAVTWSFMDETRAQEFGGQETGGQETGETASALRLMNPISQDLAVMRPTIIANLAQAVVRNDSRGNHNVCLFEIGPQYEPTQQRQMASGLRAGLAHKKHWTGPVRPVDVYDAKADALAVLSTLGVQESAVRVEAAAPIYYHPGRSGTVKQGQKTLAYFGQLHPQISQKLGTDTTMVAFEVFLDQINPSKTKKSVLSLSPFQPVLRDFAFVLDADVPADKVVQAVAKIDRALISEIDIFDVYHGDKLPVGKKSLALQVRLTPQKATMTEAEITDLSAKIITTVEKITGGVLRQ